MFSFDYIGKIETQSTKMASTKIMFGGACAFVDCGRLFILHDLINLIDYIGHDGVGGMRCC